MMRSKFSSFASRVVGVFILLPLAMHASAQSDGLAGAKYDVVDRFGVNVASSQVQITQTPLTIGGEMGLNHTITSLTSDFWNLLNHGGGAPGVGGFGDENRGGLYDVVLYKTGEGVHEREHHGLRVFGAGAQEDFKYYDVGGWPPSGEWLPYKRPSSATLEFVNSAEFTGYVLTSGDGTRRYYPGTEITPVNNYGDVGYIRRSMSKVVYPNGFTIDISTTSIPGGSLYSVRTNTGFQLKYDFTGSWTQSSPTKVTALNNAIERCPHDSSPCAPSSMWPSATYTWPVGGPDNSNLVGSISVPGIFRVQDAEGRVTDYHHESYEHVSTVVHPRIVKIVKDGNVVMNYDYAINTGNVTFEYGQPFIVPFQIARPISAWVDGGGSQTYGHITPRIYYTLIGYYQLAGSGPGKINRVETTEYGAMEKIDSWDQTVEFYHELVRDPDDFQRYVENYVTDAHQKQGGVTLGFGYDERGNVTQRAIVGSGTDITADYPTTCDSSNFRYCNKPKWIEDARGNRTYFYYHAPSGQISLRVSPRDDNFVQHRTYYEYDEYYAHYKIDSESVEAADTPIWLLSRETSCQNSAMFTNGVCSGGDAVVTTYEYDYHNL
ncbi:MAG: hypothetical protein QNJ14_17095, partial [Woeseiaceae bacterium]|nr:hypothetical protein [Woeseiaceae bacterium]